MGYATTNPYTNQTLETFQGIGDQELDQALHTAQRTFETWRTKSFDERKEVVGRAARILRERSEEFARLPTLEMGKLYRESLDEVELAASILDYYADNAEEFLAPERVATEDPDAGEAVVVSDPIGVLFGVQPWNFPYYQLARLAGPNLMAGNVVMVKHASIVPQSAAAFERLFREAGAPEGAYTNVYASKEQVDRVIQDPRVRGVALTGSEGAGSSVAARAGEELKKSTLELGGSDALIVLSDADLDLSVERALWGRLNNAGQSCVAAKRIIVVEEVADEFLRRFSEGLAELKAGDPFDPDTSLPPLSSQSAADDLDALVEEAIEHGASVITPGEPVPEEGAFVQPRILTKVSRDNPVYDKEFFGPVALFFRAADEDEAVRIANDSSFGLGGSVFTQDTAHGAEVARRIETGMVFVNHPAWTKPNLPFGGTKRSGYGQELSEAGIQEFVNKKLINVMPTG
ncbi:NAD-dependent succinate-semialdehyde dehydrogenase [Nocardiopsis alkaliphila]|uniref:NAD-dependent succinate-semialdehyde dehydrogenase n=1 Tax=Nocardiopsis alkaliphila TaxID=225762 RepID=UPI000348548E|nr:NAD-dependent succinate-semialdehyde dehydrogenase [Nocardiopsis alkaliphila]